MRKGGKSLMLERQKVIKEYENYVKRFVSLTESDDAEYEMHEAVLSLLKEQDEQIRKLQKDKDKLCLDVSEWKHKYHDRPLKGQEHSETFIVIDNNTGEEADTYDIALHEDWAKHLCYCDMEGWAIMDDGTLLLVDECGRFAYADRERFKVKRE